MSSANKEIFDPAKDIPALTGKVIFVTGGTAGIGAETVKQLAAHGPSHIYFSGRNSTAGAKITTDLSNDFPNVGFTFIEIDISSFASVKKALPSGFKHDRLDILINNAGIMAKAPGLSVDGYEIQFATNHLGHFLLFQQLLPVLLKTSELPGADVRVVSVASLLFRTHPSKGIDFEKLSSRNPMSSILGSWPTYGQSKLANILFAAEIARRYPSLTSISLHPGVVKTPLVAGQGLFNRWFIQASQLFIGSMLEPEQGAWNQVWAAAAAKKEELRNGGFYMPVGIDGSENVLDRTAKDKELAAKLWTWSGEVVAKI